MHVKHGIETQDRGGCAKTRLEDATDQETVTNDYRTIACVYASLIIAHLTKAAKLKDDLMHCSTQ